MAVGTFGCADIHSWRNCPNGPPHTDNRTPDPPSDIDSDNSTVAASVLVLVVGVVVAVVVDDVVDCVWRHEKHIHPSFQSRHNADTQPPNDPKIVVEPILQAAEPIANPQSAHRQDKTKCHFLRVVDLRDMNDRIHDHTE